MGESKKTFQVLLLLFLKFAHGLLRKTLLSLFLEGNDNTLKCKFRRTRKTEGFRSYWGSRKRSNVGRTVQLRENCYFLYLKERQTIFFLRRPTRKEANISVYLQAVVLSCYSPKSWSLDSADTRLEKRNDATLTLNWKLNRADEICSKWICLKTKRFISKVYFVSWVLL